MQLITITSGDVGETLSWLNELDKQYGLTSDEYGMGNFIEDLKKKGYIDEDPQEAGAFNITAKSEQTIRKSALEEIFGKLKKSGPGNHRTPHTGQGDEQSTDMREFRFGDSLDQISMTESIRNAQLNHGLSGEEFLLTEGDLEVRENEHKSQTSTVLMIDISHSMILYGEDRITPAKKVAMALAELVKQKYPKDFLDVLVFGNDAWQIEVKELPYLQVGPYQADLHDHGRQAYLPERRQRLLQKQLRPRPQSGQQNAEPGCRRPPPQGAHHHLHDCLRPVLAAVRERVHGGEPRQSLLQQPERFRPLNLRGLQAEPTQKRLASPQRRDSQF
jgi:hypothetical protein